MKMRTHILLLALLATSCFVKSNKNSAIIVTRVVKGTSAGPPRCVPTTRRMRNLISPT